MQRTSGSQPKYLHTGDLARMAKRTSRTICEYCRRNKIPEATRTPGGHWQIRQPLTENTKLLLRRLAGHRPLSLSEAFVGDFEPEHAQALALGMLFGVSPEEVVSDPVLIYRHGPKKRAIAEEIQRGILRREGTKKTYADITLAALISPFWKQHERRPTIAELAKLMNVSRSTFYRKYTREEVRIAMFAATEESKRELPDLDGFSALQRTTRAAKKPGFSSLHRDPYGDDELDC